jgi:hypothetical protein
MAIHMLIKDKRLKGDAPKIADNQWDSVDATTPIDHIIGWTGEVAKKNGGIRKLTIMAHGYESGGSGGFGIQLGKEGVTLGTVDKFSALKGQVKYIVLFSCAVAATAPGKRMTNGDGGLLISRLAVRTAAYVLASSAFQIYTAGGVPPQPINFGAWEGDVFLFGPNGNKRLVDWGWVPD